MRLAKCVKAFRPSPIRGMMSAVSNPNVISFAGGMPGNELFPVDDVREIVASLPREMMDKAMQYGQTDGFPDFSAAISDWMTSKGFDMTKNKIIITTGSTQCMSIVSKIMLDLKDVVFTEDPVFCGSAGAFCSYDATLVGIPMDDHGMIIEELEKAFEKHNPKFIYMTPNFHNPAGLVYSKERRAAFLKVMEKHPEVIIIEDDAYSELYYDEEVREEIVPMKTFASEQVQNQIVYTSSFSKIFGPGLRIGFMLVPNEMYACAEIAKQSMDACTPQFSQVLANEFLRSGRMKKYVAMLRDTYKVRRDTMVNCLRELTPEIKFVEPRGGFFLWAELPKSVNEKEFFTTCADKGVVFVTGDAFTPDYRETGCIRLAFSNTPPDVIKKGMQIFADTLHDMMK